MATLAAGIEEAILDHRLPALDGDLPEGELIVPQSDGDPSVNLPLTSVCPSTTMTALACLRCGRTPVEHGTLDQRLFVGNRGLEANMIYPTAVGCERHNAIWDGGMKLAETSRVCGWMSEL